MRIALIAPFAIHPKGTTRWRVLPLARALADQGHAVRVVIPPYDWPLHSGRRWQDRGVDVVNVAMPPGQTLPAHLMLAGRLARAALDWQPDVLHCFKPKGHSGLAASALLSGRAPLVMDADDYEAGWNRVLSYPALWASFFQWQERSLLRRAHAVTAASRWLESIARSLGQTRVQYLPNGVEFSRSQNAMRRQDNRLTEDRTNRLRVLLYSRFVEHGAGDVWQVWRQVLAAEPAARLLVAGQGRSGEETLLAQMAAEAGAGHSVQSLGWLPANARPGLFAAADAALLPVQDTMLNRAKSPMRLLDLLAAGVPVATQRVGEYGVMVVDGVTGLLAAPGDAAGLAGQMIRLLRAGDLRLHLGQAAAAAMQAHYAWPQLAQSALNVYHAALLRY